jgi:hypothetical protein
MAFRRANEVGDEEGANVVRRTFLYLQECAISVPRFYHRPYGVLAEVPGRPSPGGLLAQSLPPAAGAIGDGLLRFSRKGEPKGPLAVFGYDYFADHTKAAGIAEPKLLSYEGLWGAGEEYAYEVLNFADGKRTAQEIRDAVSAEYGPIHLDLVLEYLHALEKIGLVDQVK